MRPRLPVVVPLLVVGFGGSPALKGLVLGAPVAVVDSGRGGSPNLPGSDAVLRAAATSSASEEVE